MAELEEEKNEFVLEKMCNLSSHAEQHHEVVCPFPIECSPCYIDGMLLLS